MGKFITWEVLDKKLQWLLNADLMDTEQLIDGCYIIVSDVPQEKMQSQEIVASYKKLALVEKAFRNLKTVQLEVRPVYHKTDDRIQRLKSIRREGVNIAGAAYKIVTEPDKDQIKILDLLKVKLHSHTMEK